MATEPSNVDSEYCNGEYAGCIITPMSSKDGKPLVKIVHVVDALIVGGIVFISLLLGATVPQLFAGNIEYIGYAEIRARFLTALLAFGLTFLAQWARYRGIQFLKIRNRGGDE